MSHLRNLTAGLALALVIAVVARRWRALTTSGALATIVVGTVTMGAGWSWGVVLVTYFVAGTWLSRYRASEKEARTAGRVDKGGARDAAQVLANGSLFALAALGTQLSPDALWQHLAAGALAASSADTWATEIGTLARATPRSILDGRAVDAGTSGGVTALGLLGALAGAVFVALAVLGVGWPASTAASAVIGGVMGCLLDSVVGASLQARRWCAACVTTTEQRIHRCGTATTLAGGLSWLDNDGVNALSTLGGALFGATGGAYF